MSKRFKLILNYLSQFILSIVVLGLVLTVTFRFTVLNENYVLRQMEKNEYFEQLSDSILNEMSKYIVQAGLTKDVLNQIYTKDMIKEDMHTIIQAMYHNQSLTVDTTKLKENLENNVNSYLEQNNVQVADQDSLDRFINQMANIYESKLNFSGYLNSVPKMMNKINTYLNVAIISCIIAVVLFSLFIKFYLKKQVFAIPFLTSGLLILIGCYLFKSRIDINHISIWNEQISNVLISILTKLMSQLKLTAIILMIVGIMETVFLKLFRLHK